MLTTCMKFTNNTEKLCDVLCITAEEKFCIEHGKLFNTLAQELMTDMQRAKTFRKHPNFLRFLEDEEELAASTEGFFNEKVQENSRLAIIVLSYHTN